MRRLDYYFFTNNSISNDRVIYVSARFRTSYIIDKDFCIMYNVNFYKL